MAYQNISTNFLSGMEKSAYMSTKQCEEMHKQVTAFLMAKSHSQASSCANGIQTNFNTVISALPPDDRDKALTHFNNTLLRYLLDNADEVCDYGRDRLVPVINQGHGPRIEGTNHVCQERWGKHDR